MKYYVRNSRVEGREERKQKSGEGGSGRGKTQPNPVFHLFSHTHPSNSHSQILLSTHACALFVSLFEQAQSMHTLLLCLYQ